MKSFGSPFIGPVGIPAADIPSIAAMYALSGLYPGKNGVINNKTGGIFNGIDVLIALVNVDITALNKSKEKIMESTKVADGDSASRQLKYTQAAQAQLAAEPVQTYLNPKELDARLKATKKAMEKAAKELDFLEAARYRDQLKELEKQLKK